MIINYKNFYEIEKINLHDADFEKVNFDYYTKNIEIKLINRSWKDSNYLLDFHNVLYYEMTCCDFWGGGYNVVCWSSLDTTEIFDKLLRLERVEKAKSFNGTPEQYTFMNLSEYLGIEICINSGDKLKIVCKEIEITKM